MTRAALGIAAALAAILVPAAIAAGAPAGSGSAAAGLSPAAQTVAACVKRSDRVLVNVVIDRSGSLGATDPEDRRVDGVGAALLGLADLAERQDGAGPPPRVEVLLSSFAADVRPSRPGAAWRAVHDGTLSALLEQAEAYGAKDDGRDTDYALAMREARRALNARASAIVAADGEAPCKVLIFLSDGKFHVGDRTDATPLPDEVPYARGIDLGVPGGGARAVAAGRGYLCDPGALRDRMVGDGVTMFTVALSGSPQFTPDDRAFLEGLTTGGAGENACGTKLSPRSGQYVEVSDSFDLFFVFSSLVGTDRGTGRGPCAPGRCPNPTEFEASSGHSGFVLSATSPLAGVELELTAPDGERKVLADGGAEELSVGGAAVGQHWIRSRSMEVTASFDPDSDAWQGTWRFRFLNPDDPGAPVPVYELTLRSGLRAALAGDPELSPGERAELTVVLLDAGGRPAAPGDLRAAAQIEAELVDAGGAAREAAVRRVASGRFLVPVEVPDDEAEGDWAVRGELGFPGEAPAVAARAFALPIAVKGEEGPGTLVVIAVTAALLALLAALAVLVSYLRRRAAARFTAPQLLRAFRCAAIVTPGGPVELDPDPGPLGLGFDELRHVRDSGTATPVAQLRVGPFSFAARVPWRLRAKPDGEVTAGGGPLLGGRAGGGVSANPERTALSVPLELAGTWLFAPASVDDEGRVHGDLAIFTDDRSAPELGDEVLEAARAALSGGDWDHLEISRAEDAELPGPDGAGNGLPAGTAEFDLEDF